MAQSQQLTLSVVTPESSIVTDVAVESIILPGEEGQLTILPGHINFITPLRPGTFAYKVGGEFQIAFLSGGFAQVFNGNVSVLAETLDMAQDLDLAATELSVAEYKRELEALKVGTAEYSALVEKRDFALAKIRTAQKKIH
ncbi:MAG: ATP synthase F1 subunit epsilon [Proteobacteria bacterium]|nr:MAG: ATP synthase F1 subunit epsilon [Pseudomonadota bacterium]